MRIIYLHQYFVTPAQAGGTRSYEMARRLVAMGHQVEVITTDVNGTGAGPLWRTTEENGVRIHWANIPYNNHMTTFARMRAFVAFALHSSRRAAATPADVIFATSTPLTIAIPAIFASWRRKIPYVFEVRDIWPAVPIALGMLKNPALRWLAYRLEHIAYHRAARVVALAPGMGEEVQKTGYPADKIAIIPNGCDVDLLGGDPARMQPLPAEAEVWLGDSPLVLFAGTLGRANGVGYVAEIAAVMLERDPGIRFMIVGDGADRDSIAERATELKVLNVNLKLVPAMPKVALAGFVARSSLCLSLFSGPRVLWKDSVQNKFFDGLAAGKPVATNHAGWQCQVAVAEDVGIEIATGDPALAADSIRNAVRDAVWLDGVRERAKVLANGRFSRDTLARDLNHVLQHALQEHDRTKA